MTKHPPGGRAHRGKILQSVRATLVATSFVACSVLASPSALAQDKPPTSPKPTDDQSAALAYRKALAAYDRGDLPGALQYMQESYSLSGRGELLFNLARLERESSQCPAALRDYARYLHDVPNGRYRADAERAIAELDVECPVEPAPLSEPAPRAPRSVSEPPPAAAVPAPTPLPIQTIERPADASYWTTARVVGWSAVATGAVTGGVALYFFGSAVSDRNEVARQAAGLKFAPENPPWDDALASQHRNLRASQILGVTAGVLVAGGVTLLILDPKAESSRRASATLAASPGYLGAVCSGSF